MIRVGLLLIGARWRGAINKKLRSFPPPPPPPPPPFPPSPPPTHPHTRRATMTINQVKGQQVIILT